MSQVNIAAPYRTIATESFNWAEVTHRPTETSASTEMGVDPSVNRGDVNPGF